MALRPTDIQLILQISRDVERVQLLQQQYGQRQQEHLTAYMERQLEEKKKQATPVKDSAEAELRAIHEEDPEEKRKFKQSKKRESSEGKFKKKIGGSIDMFI